MCVRVDDAPPARRATPRAWKLLGESVSVDGNRDNVEYLEIIPSYYGHQPRAYFILWFCKFFLNYLLLLTIAYISLKL